MTKHSRVGDLPIEIVAESFPIIGGDPDIRGKIERERQSARADLSDTYIMAGVDYDDPHYDESPYPEKRLEVENIRIRRNEAMLLFEAMGQVYAQEAGKPWKYNEEGEKIPVAQVAVPVSGLLRIARVYLEDQGANEQIIREYTAAGVLTGVEDVERHRKLLHADMAREIEKYLEKGTIRFTRLAGQEGFEQWRYISTAIIMHILPARTFENEFFLRDNVRPKQDLRERRRSDFKGPA